MHSFLVGADNFDVVLAQGPDASRFLQGQLTCDVAALADNGQTYGACCNNKGRVIAGFVLIRMADTFYFCMPHGSGDVLIEALRKYLPFYKCSLTTAPPDQRLFALAGATADEALRLEGARALESGQALPVESGWLCKLEGKPSRALWWCNQAPKAILEALNTPVASALEQWETLALLNGHYPLRPADSGLYTPQELNYDQNGYINFSKGCYTGQEIVARMHYRGKPKKQLYLVKLAQRVATIEKGQPLVTDAQGQSLGSCRLTRSDGTLHLALIELATDFTGDFSALKLADSVVTAGCAFEQTVIRLAHLITL